jgi:hypothetical protein
MELRLAAPRLPLQLIVSLYRNTACRWPLHSFRDCIRGPESRSYDFDGMAWQNWWHLLHVMTKRNQLAGYTMCCHASLDSDHALWHVRKPFCDPTARKLLAQNDRPWLSRPIKCNVFLPVSVPIVVQTVAAVLVSTVWGFKVVDFRTGICPRS